VRRHDEVSIQGLPGQAVAQAAEYTKQQEHVASQSVKKQATVAVAAKVRELINRLGTKK
jgi:hypothetical protein